MPPSYAESQYSGLDYPYRTAESSPLKLEVTISGGRQLANQSELESSAGGRQAEDVSLKTCQMLPRASFVDTRDPKSVATPAT